MAEDGSNTVNKESSIAFAEEFLKSKGKSLDSLSPGKKKRFEVVAEIIWNTLNQRKDAEIILKNNQINISRVAAATGTSNKTFYNDKILGDFVKSYETKPDGKTAEIVEMYAQRLRVAENKIKQLTLNAIDSQLLKVHIRELEAENDRLNSRIVANENLIEELHNELMMLKNKNECDVIDFETGKILKK